MEDKFQNKYRIPSARHQNWDYGTNGAYFITICTKDRQRFFGKCADGKILNPNCCACVCPEVKQCEAGFEFSDKTCTCVDKIEPKCPPRMIFNEAINKCVCRAIASCLPPKIFFDSEMCECACNETTCNDGTLNSETCKCEASESE